MHCWEKLRRRPGSIDNSSVTIGNSIDSDSHTIDLYWEISKLVKDTRGRP